MRKIFLTVAIILSLLNVTACSNQEHQSSENSVSNALSDNSVSDDVNIVSNQNITSAKCYKIDFQKITEDQVTALFKAVPQREESARFPGRVDYKVGDEGGFLSPTLKNGIVTYYLVGYMTKQGNDYDTAAHIRYDEIAENRDWDFLSRPDAKKKVSEILSPFMLTGTSVEVYAISKDCYLEYVKEQTDKDGKFGGTAQKDWGTAADYYYFRAEQTVDGIPIQQESIGNINTGTQTWGADASGVLSADGLGYLRVYSPYKIVGEVETPEKFITYSEAEQLFKDKNDSFLITEEITLNSARLVYVVLRTEDNSLILNPAWEFKYNDIQLFLLNAYTGEEIVTI